MKIGDIEKGIPIHDIDVFTFNKYHKWPFRNMEVGDSVFIECDGGGLMTAPLMNRAKQNTKGRGMKFTSRVVPNGLRIWRIA